MSDETTNPTHTFKPEHKTKAAGTKDHVHRKLVGHLEDEKDKKVNNSDYLKAFGWVSECPEDSLRYDPTSRLAKAYEISLDVRKFEIELYWKRSTNFWVLIAAIAAALGVLSGGGTPVKEAVPVVTESSKEIGCLILSLAATMLCSGWWLANKASKFWQRNWESQVDVLEQEVLGPLYKTVFSKTGEFSENPHYSISDINKWASAYLAYIFGFLSLYFIGADIIVTKLIHLARNTQSGWSPFPIVNFIISCCSMDFTQFSVVKFIIVVFNGTFVMLFKRKNRIKTGSEENRLDIQLEASTRAAILNSIIGSESGGKNLIPKECSSAKETLL